MINNTSIYCFIICLVSFLPQTIYFLLKGRRSLPLKMYQGWCLFFALISLMSALASAALIFLFSTDFGSINRFFFWQLTSHTGLALILLSWILFIMHGYECRYMFKKIVVPAHMNVLIALIFILTVLLSWNLWALIPVSLFTIFSLIWSFKAYKLTKPLIDENIPLRENDDL